MATAHQLAVVTNSCFKAPVKSKTTLGYQATDQQDVRDQECAWDRATENGSLENDISKLHLSQSVNFDTTLMQTMNADLSHMSDDEFYQRLTELKKEHRKTLEFCEKLYHEQLFKDKSGCGTDAAPSRSVPRASVDSNYVLSSSLNGSFRSTGETSQTVPADHVKDMSASKPPTGRPKPSHSPGTPTRSGSPKFRQAWMGNRSDEFSRTLSGNFSDTDVAIEEIFSASHDKNRSFRESRPESRQSTRSRIDDMWENFSVDDYAPPQVRQRSSSLSRLSGRSSARKEEKNKAKEWSQCITIPKPFSMTLREANKTPKKTKAMEEVERKREEHLRKEEEECQKRFKAKPVPAHVYMPLFDEIMEEKETRRRQVKEESVGLTRSLQKPFKFDIREQEQKKFRRSHSSPVKSDISKPPKTTFKARPFPEHLFEDSTMDRLKEEEEYRKIKMQMRAEELLRSSKLPNNMGATSRKYTDGKSRKTLYKERAKKAGLTTEHKFQPRVNGTVPDFEQLHHKFITGVSKKKQQQQATVCKPFKFNTAQVVTKRHKIYEDIALDEDSMRENQYTFQGFRPLSKSALSTSMDSIPTKMTTAAQLRSSSTKTKMQSQLEREIFEAEKERRKRQKQKQLQKYIAERAASNDNSCILNNTSKQKLKEYRLAEKARHDEYKRQLDEINSRVKSRPLLFERTMQDNAKKRAEKKYDDTLKKAGLDNKFISTRGVGADIDDLDLDSEGYEEMPGNSDRDGSSPEHSSRHQSHSHSLTGSHPLYSQDFDDDDGTGAGRGSYTGDEDPGDRTGEDEEEIEEEFSGED